MTDKKIILIAEDDELLQRACRRMLGDHNNLKFVSTATDAIDLLRSIKFDAIISNYRLVQSTGLEILQWLHVHQPHNVDRFIFFTGWPLPPHTHHRIVTKPVTGHELRDELAKVMG